MQYLPTVTTRNFKLIAFLEVYRSSMENTTALSELCLSFLACLQ